jgi:sugar-phosphatase
MIGGVLLFDVDGVLLDSTAAYRHAWARWAADHDLPPIGHCAYGRRPIDIIRAAAPQLDPATELQKFRHILASVEHVAAMAGARELLLALPAGTWAVVSSGERQEIVGRMAKAGLPTSEVAVAGEDVTNGKPDPSGYRLAALRLGAPPARCVVIEDAPAGVTAAKTAGMRVVAVCTTHDETQLAAADRIYGTLAEAAPSLLADVADLRASGLNTRGQGRQ